MFKRFTIFIQLDDIFSIKHILYSMYNHMNLKNIING